MTENSRILECGQLLFRQVISTLNATSNAMIQRPRPITALPILRNEDDPSAIAFRDNIKTQIRSSIVLSLIFILLLIIVGFVLFSVPIIKPPAESIRAWIERFGALIGILSLAIEYQLKKAHKWLDCAALNLPPPLYKSLNDSYRLIPIYEKFSFISAIIGALIWAYGSVFIYWIFCI